jgi:hypothetical protein
MFLLLFILFVLSLPFLGYKLFGGIGGAIDKMNNKREEKRRPTYIDNSVHHHTHEHGNRFISNENHLHQNLTVIDEETHKRGLEQFEKENDVQ